MILAFSQVASASPNRKLDFLLHFFDLNEAAFAYQRQCQAESEGINETFLRNLEFVADELFAAAVQKDPQISPDQIKERILERRSTLQYKLDHFYMSNDCSSAGAKTAQAHYEEFSRFNKSEVSKFINARVAAKQSKN